jgi:hypothetical protein
MGPATACRARRWRRRASGAGAREQLRQMGGAGACGCTRLGRARIELRRGSSGRTHPGGREAARRDGLVWAGLGPRRGGGAVTARRARKEKLQSEGGDRARRARRSHGAARHGELPLLMRRSGRSNTARVRRAAQDRRRW